jgi:hypothetical protein
MQRMAFDEPLAELVSDGARLWCNTLPPGVRTASEGAGRWGLKATQSKYPLGPDARTSAAFEPACAGKAAVFYGARREIEPLRSVELGKHHIGVPPWFRTSD